MELPLIFSRAGAQAAILKWAQDTAERINAAARAYYEQYTAPGWTETVRRNRELSLAEPPKPLPPMELAVIITDGWADIAPGGTPVCAPAPDVPIPAPPPAGAVVRLGPCLAEPWYACLEGDTAPIGFEVSQGGKTYRKEAGIFGLPHYTHIF